MKVLNQFFHQSNYEGDWLSFCGLLTGGNKRKRNLMFIHKYPKIIIGTCGILSALITEGVIIEDQIEMLILDEIDQTIKMGFQNDLLQIIRCLPHAQVLGFSATATDKVSREVEEMTNSKFTLLDLSEDDVANSGEDKNL